MYRFLMPFESPFCYRLMEAIMVKIVLLIPNRSSCSSKPCAERRGKSEHQTAGWSLTATGFAAMRDKGKCHRDNSFRRRRKAMADKGEKSPIMSGVSPLVTAEGGKPHLVQGCMEGRNRRLPGAPSLQPLEPPGNSGPREMTTPPSPSRAMEGQNSAYEFGIGKSVPYIHFE